MFSDEDGDGLGDAGEKMIYTTTVANTGNVRVGSTKVSHLLEENSALVCNTGFEAATSPEVSGTRASPFSPCYCVSRFCTGQQRRDDSELNVSRISNTQRGGIPWNSSLCVLLSQAASLRTSWKRLNIAGAYTAVQTKCTLPGVRSRGGRLAWKCT